MNTRLVLRLSIVAFLVIGLLHAQQAKELPRHPGEVLRFEVKFEGPDTAKVRTVSLGLQATPTTTKPSNQSGFISGFSSEKSVEASSPGIFRPEIKIPDNAMSGDYYLIVSAQADTGNVGYEAGKQFQLHLFHIENTRTFTPPTITVKELP